MMTRRASAADRSDDRHEHDDDRRCSSSSAGRARDDVYEDQEGNGGEEGENTTDFERRTSVRITARRIRARRRPTMQPMIMPGKRSAHAAGRVYGLDQRRRLTPITFE